MSLNNNFDFNSLLNKAKENKARSASTGEVNSFIEENLSPSQAKAVTELLNDKEKTRKLLESDSAKALFKKFFGGNENG